MFIDNSEKTIENAKKQLAKLIDNNINLEAWVEETSIEYRRFLKLKSIGASDMPNKDSLLGRFLTYALNPSEIKAYEGTTQYETVFGQKVPYVWNKTLESLLSQSEVDSCGGSPSGS